MNTTKLVRVDKAIWDKCCKLFPNEKSATISRMLYNNSLLKIESHLKEQDFANKLGTFIYGNVWMKKKK